MLPFAGALWDATIQAEIQSKGEIGFGPIMGWGNGMTERRARSAGRFRATKQPNDCRTVVPLPILGIGPHDWSKGGVAVDLDL